MNHERDYVNLFYQKYNGRVAIGVGYNQDLSEIYHLFFKIQPATQSALLHKVSIHLKILTMST